MPLGPTQVHLTYDRVRGDRQSFGAVGAGAGHSMSTVGGRKLASCDPFFDLPLMSRPVF